MRLPLFFVLNFGALALGSYLMGEGPMGSWYTNLNKAPWTPPGWVFGASWTLIMICLSIFMNKAVQIEALSKTILWIYGVQLVLNILWNPLFFDLHWVGIALIKSSYWSLLLDSWLLRLSLICPSLPGCLLPM